jgi:hypothetical protein
VLIGVAALRARQYPDIAGRMGGIAPERARLTGEMMKASGRSASARPKIALSPPLARVFPRIWRTVIAAREEAKCRGSGLVHSDT